MYIPKYFKVTNVDEIWDFVQKNSFGTIITTKKEKPIATHLPFGLTKQGDDYFITGHMAYGNPQWRTFETCEDVLIMFQGQLDNSMLELLHFHTKKKRYKSAVPDRKSVV